jgi:hypothetical protein
MSVFSPLVFPPAALFTQGSRGRGYRLHVLRRLLNKTPRRAVAMAGRKPLSPYIRAEGRCPATAGTGVDPGNRDEIAWIEWLPNLRHRSSYRKIAIPVESLSHFCDTVNVAMRPRAILFADADGHCPFLGWMDLLPMAAQDRCIVRIERLEEIGEAIAESECKQVGNGVHQIVFRSGGSDYAILFFFHNSVAVILHGCPALSLVGADDLAAAVERKRLFCGGPDGHTYREEE